MEFNTEFAFPDTRIEVAPNNGRRDRSLSRARLPACLFAAAGVALVASCGGGGGSSPPPPVPYTAGVYKPSSSFKNQCAAPRSGVDPFTNTRYPDVAGSTLAENNWLRSWTNELYLWYFEVLDLDPGNYSTTAAYFPLLKTSGTNPSGTPKDKSGFHFTYPTATGESLSLSGVQAGYGATWDVVASRPPRNIVVAYTDPGTPATANAIVRGAKVVTVDGVDLINSATQASVDLLNAGLFPTAAGQMHSFGIIDPGMTAPRTVTMTSANITSTPVQNVGLVQGTTGYILFNDHIATAEQGLINAISSLKTQGATDLVLDLRYNLGGLLDIASELAYMIAGPAQTSGKTFELPIFNDKHPTIDPVTNRPIVPVPFLGMTVGLSVAAGQPLPHLDLPRVFVLTGSNTCSASESIINGLQGIGVMVYQFGSTTCGKPYGFYPTDNCGTTYFSIQIQGVNQLNFGAYGDGFAPANTAGNLGFRVAGCSVADDLNHALGDPNEGRLAAALAFSANPSANICPPATGLAKQQMAGGVPNSVDGTVPKSIWQQNRIYRH